MWKLVTVFAVVAAGFPVDNDHTERIRAELNEVQILDNSEKFIKEDPDYTLTDSNLAVLTHYRQMLESNSSAVALENKEMVKALMAVLKGFQWRSFIQLEWKTRRCNEKAMDITDQIIRFRNQKNDNQDRALIGCGNGRVHLVQYKVESSASRSLKRALMKGERNFQEVDSGLEKLIRNQRTVVCLLGSVMIKSKCKQSIVEEKEHNKICAKPKETRKFIQLKKEKPMLMQCGAQLAFADAEMRQSFRDVPDMNSANISLAFGGDETEAFMQNIFLDLEGRFKKLSKMADGEVYEEDFQEAQKLEMEEDELKASMDEFLQTRMDKSAPKFDEVVVCRPNMKPDCAPLLQLFGPWYRRAFRQLKEVLAKQKIVRGEWNRDKGAMNKLLRKSATNKRMESMRYVSNMEKCAKAKNKAKRFGKYEAREKNKRVRVDRQCKRRKRKLALRISTLSCLKENIVKIAKWPKAEWPVDCRMTDFEENNSTCSAECGSGKIMKKRRVIQMDKNIGVPCGNTEEQAFPCNEQICPVDCELSDWSKWSTCTKTCGGGKKFQRRTILVANRGPTGMKCENQGNDEGCNKGSCVKTIWNFDIVTDVKRTGLMGSPESSNPMQGVKIMVPIATEPRKGFLPDGFQRVSKVSTAKYISSGNLGFDRKHPSVSAMVKPFSTVQVTTMTKHTVCKPKNHHWWDFSHRRNRRGHLEHSWLYNLVRAAWGTNGEKTLTNWPSGFPDPPLWRLKKHNCNMWIRPACNEWNRFLDHAFPKNSAYYWQFCKIETKWNTKFSTQMNLAATCPLGFFLNAVQFKNRKDAKKPFTYSAMDRFFCLKRKIAKKNYQKCMTMPIDWAMAKNLQQRVSFTCKKKWLLAGFEQDFAKVNDYGLKAIRAFKCCKPLYTKRR